MSISRWSDRSVEQLIYDPEFNAEIEFLARPPEELKDPHFCLVENGNMFYEWCNVHHGSGWRLN